MAVKVNFQNGDRSHLGFCRWSEIWRQGQSRLTRIYLQTKFGEYILKGGQVMTIYVFSKWRPAAILVFETTHEGEPGLKCPFKFRVDLIYFVEDIAISIFLTFGLKLPNHAHFWSVLIPWTVFFCHRNPQKAHPWVNPRRLMYRSCESVHAFYFRGPNLWNALSNELKQSH